MLISEVPSLSLSPRANYPALRTKFIVSYSKCAERERERETTGTKRVIDLLGFFPFFLSFSLTRFPLQLRLLLTNEGGLDSFHSQRSPFDVAKEDLIITLRRPFRSVSGMPVRAQPSAV